MSSSTALVSSALTAFENDLSPLVSLTQARVTFEDRLILGPIDLNIFPKEILTVIGPNGAGKSTLMKVLLGIQQLHGGEIFRAKGLRMGYVPQRFHPSASLPLRVRDWLKIQSAHSAVLQRIIDEIDLASLWNKSIHHLSGGERQRVLLAHALLRQPHLLVLDEPMQGLDMQSEQILYDYIRQLPQTKGCSVVIVSHDLQWVMQGTQRVICLNGHICCSGLPQDIQYQPEYQALFGHRVPYVHHHQQCQHDSGV